MFFGCWLLLIHIRSSSLLIACAGCWCHTIRLLCVDRILGRFLLESLGQASHLGISWWSLIFLLELVGLIRRPPEACGTSLLFNAMLWQVVIATISNFILTNGLYWWRGVKLLTLSSGQSNIIFVLISDSVSSLFSNLPDIFYLYMLKEWWSLWLLILKLQLYSATVMSIDISFLNWTWFRLANYSHLCSFFLQYWMLLSFCLIFIIALSGHSVYSFWPLLKIWSRDQVLIVLSFRLSLEFRYS